MNTLSICPECGAAWENGITCTDHFHQMLYWEAEYPDYGIVHHLMVLSYHLQHPSLYSPDGLAVGITLLDDFLNHGLTTEAARKRHAKQAKVKIKGTADAHGAYDHPVQWTMRAGDVVAAGHERYIDSVQQWARSIDAALKRA